ncbi:hypothetical protein LV779_24820 [Streptomyces thinghirensis]|nr:hypothetical protein [Streptomyces thinghirensis]
MARQLAGCVMNEERPGHHRDYPGLPRLRGVRHRRCRPPPGPDAHRVPQRAGGGRQRRYPPRPDRRRPGRASYVSRPTLVGRRPAHRRRSRREEQTHLHPRLRFAARRPRPLPPDLRHDHLRRSLSERRRRAAQQYGFPVRGVPRPRRTAGRVQRGERGPPSPEPDGFTLGFGGDTSNAAVASGPRRGPHRLPHENR